MTQARQLATPHQWSRWHRVWKAERAWRGQKQRRKNEKGNESPHCWLVFNSNLWTHLTGFIRKSRNRNLLASVIKCLTELHLFQPVGPVILANSHCWGKICNSRSDAMPKHVPYRSCYAAWGSPLIQPAHETLINKLNSWSPFLDSSSAQSQLKCFLFIDPISCLHACPVMKSSDPFPLHKN